MVPLNLAGVLMDPVEQRKVEVQGVEVTESSGGSPVYLPDRFEEENTENPSMVRVAEENIPKQGASKMNTVTDIFPPGHRKRIPKRRLECDYDGDSDQYAESDCEDSRKTEITCAGLADRR